MMHRKPFTSILQLALFSFAIPLVACDAVEPALEEDEELADADDVADTDVVADSDAFEDDLDDLGGSSGEAFDDGITDLQDALDPQAAGWAGWVGGFGGSYASSGCPGGFSVIGVAASSTGSYVRQLALVCGPDSRINAGQGVPTTEQFVIASGYYNNGFNGLNTGLVSANWNWRPVWDESDTVFAGPYRYKAPGTGYRLCNPGYEVSKIDVHAGSYVDRIDSITCEWSGAGFPPGGAFIYPRSVNIGGGGGVSRSSSCQSVPGSGTGDGAGFRSAYWLDGFRMWCG